MDLGDIPSLLNYRILIGFGVRSVIVFSYIPTNEPSWLQWTVLNTKSFRISWVNSTNHKRKQKFMSKKKEFIGRELRGVGVR